MANGGEVLLFDVEEDPSELAPLQAQSPEVVDELMQALRVDLRRSGVVAAFDGDALRVFPYRRRPLLRIHQFDLSRGVGGFPAEPDQLVYLSRSDAVGGT